ncbi:HAMP domain-containing sensor histidine kinase [Allokutzneria multivorans]|uniref:histidine kinase n=1 Tax=Allokutzneria multivorans TaxID=1142134 RepID=A0ABP7T7Y3_9PSEU
MTGLRRRMVLLTVLLSAVALTAVAALTFTSMRSFLLQRTDEQLNLVRLPIGAKLAGEPIKEPPRGVQHTLVNVYGVLRGPDGRFGPETRFGTGVSTVDKPVLADLPAIGQAKSVEGYAGVRYRIAAYEALQGLEGTLYVAMPLTEVDATLDRLFVLVVVITAAVLLALLVFALSLVRIGLRPLDEMEATATAIASGEYHRRIAYVDKTTEVGRLGLALNTMLGRIEDAFAQRSRSEQRLRTFVADASHELRTPLTSILGYAQMFHRGAAADPEDLRTVMRRIEGESSRMTRLVEDLLVLARLDEGRPPRRAEIDVAALCRDAVLDASAHEPGRVITGPGEAPVLVDADADQLRQVLANLLRNALTHTPPGTPVEVVLTRSGEEVTIDVVDHGPGIPAEHHEQVFDRFFRVAAGRERDSGGAGLGLSIVAAVVRAHGGRIGVLDTPGGGATFRLVLSGEP